MLEITGTVTKREMPNFFVEATDYAPGTDAHSFIGGDGSDIALYWHRSKAVTADADAVKGDDGAAGEKDTIGASVEGITGGFGKDRLIGTPRADHLIGGPGNDVIAGGAGNDVLEGLGGSDYLNGAAGDDQLQGDKPEWAPIAADTLLGGAGTDTVTYSWYTKPLVVDLDGATGDDGVAGEKDTVGADVENLSGGEGSDRLTGNAADNVLDGWQGANVISGGAGDDQLDGNGRLDGGADRTAAGDICRNGPDIVVIDCERVLL